MDPRASAAGQLHPCTLIYISNHGHGENNRSLDQFSYVRQALTLSRSLVSAGYPRLTIYTNRVDDVAGYIQRTPMAWRPDVVELWQRMQVPEDVRFYGAHYKLDLLEQAADALGPDDIMLMLDCDIVANSSMLLSFLNASYQNELCVYDITEFVLYSTGDPSDVVADLEKVAGRSLPNARWYGGEFLLGKPDKLRVIANLGRECYARYVEVYPSLRHQGDEAYMSAAINIMSLDHGGIREVGAWRMVVRHWSGIPYRSSAWMRSCALIHLPGSKRIIEAAAFSLIDSEFDRRRLLRRVSRADVIARMKWMLLHSAKRRLKSASS